MLERLWELERLPEAVELCQLATAQDPYDENCQMLMMRLLHASGAKQAVAQYYNDVSALLMSQLGVSPSPEMTALYHELNAPEQAQELDLRTIRAVLLGDDSANRGAFFCQYFVFRNICRLLARISVRNGQIVQLGVITLFSKTGGALAPSQRAAAMEELAKPGTDNPAWQYAAARHGLYCAGKKVELLACYEPSFRFFAEWWKQLYGESEGKDGKGIFPAAVDNSTDLHSMGQWIQEGERIIFETVISVLEQKHEKLIPSDEANLDGLNYIAGKHIDEVNKMAELGTRIAHVDGGVPNMLITIPALREKYLGQLIYFFEKACGISGYILDVNPFNQPGVEDYKRNMFALLQKPGYEKETEAIQSRLK